MTLRTKLLVMPLLVLLTSCGIVKKETLTRAPDAPMLVTNVNGSTATMALYDRESNSMVEWGKVDVDELKGWTVSNFDWVLFIEDQ